MSNWRAAVNMLEQAHVRVGTNAITDPASFFRDKPLNILCKYTLQDFGILVLNRDLRFEKPGLKTQGRKRHH